MRKSLERAMKCRHSQSQPPKIPVMAVSPARFVQVVVILHQKFNTSTCGPTPNSTIKVSDERTWPFCAFGRCVQGQCHCPVNFVGVKCGFYTKKCWLMYCFLTSCHPAHQSLHCRCDPSLYGTPVSSGIYWYNEGRRSKYMPPPLSWHRYRPSMSKAKSSHVRAYFKRKYDIPRPFRDLPYGIMMGEWDHDTEASDHYAADNRVPSYQDQEGFFKPKVDVVAPAGQSGASRGWSSNQGQGSFIGQKVNIAPGGQNGASKGWSSNQGQGASVGQKVNIAPGGQNTAGRGWSSNQGQGASVGQKVNIAPGGQNTAGRGWSSNQGQLGSTEQKVAEGSMCRTKLVNGKKVSSCNQRNNEKTSDTGSKPGNSNQLSVNVKAMKSDVDKALDELEEVSEAKEVLSTPKASSASLMGTKIILVVIIFVNIQQRIHRV